MILLTLPILLSSTSVPPLTSKDGASIFVTSSTSLFITESENHTTARRNKVLHEGQILPNCQEDLKTFNSTLNSSYPDQWSEKVATSFCAYNDSINNLTHWSNIKMPKKASEEFEKKPKDALAPEFSTGPSFRLVTDRPSDMFSKKNPPLSLEEATIINATGNQENYTEMSPSTEKDYFAQSTLSVAQVTSPTVLDNEQGLDLFLTFTCQGRCGKKISFPCSCSATCVIYGTCCDNMAQDCPHVWEEGLTRFDLISTSDFICDQNSIYTIVSCPIVERNEKVSETSNKQISREETESRKIKNQLLSNLDTIEQRQNVVRENTTRAIEPEKTRKDSITGRLVAALSSAPVTDSDTGLTFINKTVYNCNNMLESNALYWAVMLNYSYTSPTKLEDFVRHQMLNKYIPDFNKEILTDHVCVPNLQQSCNQAADIEEPSSRYVKKCLERNNAVVISIKTLLHYRNIFCAYCNEGRHNRIVLNTFNTVPFSGSPFQVLMTLTEDTFSLKQASLGFQMFKMPWSQANCTMQAQSSVEEVFNAEKSDQDSQTPCSLTCAEPEFTLRSDGMCKAPHQVLLAIADDGLAALCPETVSGLAQFLACGLKREIENLKNADFSAPSVSVVFDSSLNRSLYVVRLNFALPQKASEIFLYEIDVTYQNLYSVALLVKSFHHYRKSLRVCPLRKENKKDTGSRIFASSSFINVGVGRKAKIKQVMEELRGPIVDDQNKTTVCLTKTAYCYKECPTNLLNPNLLFCMDDPVHERDSEWISTFRSSSCFYHLNELKRKAKNRATSFKKGYESLQQLSRKLPPFIHELSDRKHASATVLTGHRASPLITSPTSCWEKLMEQKDDELP
ncbi:hypothetical protein PoB_006180500 [Plakobranchus ocellatus]|uniref:SMB domain-containing protein n=1 Tax=Plakobranchus ocellatus TaxID=259542 RepID=A0AAV4CU27_9GAST|nr:hypothetical protein PoB_006180500 [Plakobranchus ocellatus]